MKTEELYTSLQVSFSFFSLCFSDLQNLLCFLLSQHWICCLIRIISTTRHLTSTFQLFNAFHKSSTNPIEQWIEVAKPPKLLREKHATRKHSKLGFKQTNSVHIKTENEKFQWQNKRKIRYNSLRWRWGN